MSIVYAIYVGNKSPNALVIHTYKETCLVADAGSLNYEVKEKLRWVIPVTYIPILGPS